MSTAVCYILGMCKLKFDTFIRTKIITLKCITVKCYNSAVPYSGI